jgi:hypothetical protein
LKAEATKCQVKNGEIPIRGELAIEGEILPEYEEQTTAGVPYDEPPKSANRN